MNKRLLVGMFALTIVALTSCQKEDAPAYVSQADMALLEKMKAKETEKANLSANPSAYISVTSYKSFDKGIINRYTKIIEVDLSNTSQFFVSNIKGMASIMNDKGQVIGAIPFEVVGEVGPGQKAKLKVNSGEISGSGPRANFEIKTVTVRE